MLSLSMLLSTVLKSKAINMAKVKVSFYNIQQAVTRDVPFHRVSNTMVVGPGISLRSKQIQRQIIVMDPGGTLYSSHPVVGRLRTIARKTCDSP